MMIGHLGEAKRTRREASAREDGGMESASDRCVRKGGEGGSLHEAVRARRRKDEEEGMI